MDPEPTGHGIGVVAVVGTVVLDVVRSADGAVHHALGGIAHAVAALSALAGDGIEIVPVCRVGPGLGERLDAAWGPLGNVSARGRVPGERPPPRSHLTYGAAGAQADRTERLEGAVDPLSSGEVEVVGDADLVLVNAITGRDLTTAALESLAAAGGRLYLDFHGRAFRPDARGHRRLGRPADWRRWVDAAGFLQCNEVEAEVLAGRDPQEVVAGAGEAGSGSVRPEVEELAADLLAGGGRTEAVVVTRGERGAVGWVATTGAAGGRERSGIERSGRPRAGTGDPEPRRTGVDRFEAPAPAVEVVDPTGAGDVFGAACALAWAWGGSPVAAVTAGVEAGSAACTAAGPPSPEVLRPAGGR